MKKLKDLWPKIVKRLEKLDWVPVLLTRLTIGVTFAESGWGKLHDLPKVIDFFKTLGIPAPELQAPFVASVEFFGGTFILIGLFTRIASVPLIVTMIVAILTAKMQDLSSWTDLFGFIEFLYIVLLCFLITKGPGRVSVDQALKKKFF